MQQRKSKANPGSSLRLFDPLNLILLVLTGAKVARTGMCFKVLSSSSPSTKSTKIAASLFRSDLLIGAGFQILANPETTGVAGRRTGREDVICANDLVNICQYIQIQDSGYAFDHTLSPKETHVFSPRNRAP